MALHDDLREGTVNLERLVASKKPHLLRWVPRWVMAYLRRILHLESVNRTIQEHPGLMGVAFADVVLAEMEVTYRVEGLQRLSPEGRYLVVSNHPLGGLDGMVLISAFGHAFEQIYFPVNDFLTLLPQFADIFLPINKHGAQSAEAARRLHRYSISRPGCARVSAEAGCRIWPGRAILWLRPWSTNVMWCRCISTGEILHSSTTCPASAGP